MDMAHGPDSMGVSGEFAPLHIRPIPVWTIRPQVVWSIHPQDVVDSPQRHNFIEN
jgi:hypothetical protein